MTPTLLLVVFAALWYGVGFVQGRETGRREMLDATADRVQAAYDQGASDGEHAERTRIVRNIYSEAGT